MQPLGTVPSLKAQDLQRSSVSPSATKIAIARSDSFAVCSPMARPSAETVAAADQAVAAFFPVTPAAPEFERDLPPLCLAAVAFTQEESEVLAEDPQASNIEANF